MGFKDLFEILGAFVAGFMLRGTIVSDAQRVGDILRADLAVARTAMIDEFRKMTAAVRVEAKKII